MIDHRLLQLVEEQVMPKWRPMLHWRIVKGDSWAEFTMSHEEGCRCPCHHIDIAIHIDSHAEYDGKSRTHVTVASDDVQHSIELTDEVLAQAETPELRTIISGMASKVLR